MSLNGEINKYSGEIKRAIKQIATQSISSIDGTPRGTRKIVGYVCNIHEDGELAGTVDVQEYGYEPGDYSIKGVGHHEGVLLSAIQDNDGFQIVPMLFSDVVIVQNPLDGHEYVLMYSHAKRIAITAHALKGESDSNISIGVTETEDFVETDDGLEKSFQELEPTKNKTLTTYTSTSITDVITSPQNTKGYQEEKTAERKTINIGDTQIVIDGQNVSIQTSGKVSFKIGGTEIMEDSGSVTIKTTQAKIETSTCEIKGNDVTVNGTKVTITGGTLQTRGVASTDLNGPYNALKACPFTGAPHCGSIVSGT